MNKAFFMLAILFATGIKSYASYERTYLPNLIENSSIIVYAKIVSINDYTFSIKVIKCLKSKKSKLIHKLDTLYVQKFYDWTCGTRYSEYVLQQRAIFFIEIDSEGELQIMGSDNEGELIVRSDTAFISDYNQKWIPSVKVDFLFKYGNVILLDIETVIEGIHIYLNNIKDINKEFENRSVKNRDLLNPIVYQYSFIENLPSNIFVNIVLDQRFWYYR